MFSGISQIQHQDYYLFMLRISLLILPLSVVVLAGLLMPWPFRTLPLPLRAILDFMHLPLFFCVTLLIAWLSKDQNARKAICITSLLVVLVELIQPLTGRSAELHDLLNGFLGVLFAWLILSRRAKGVQHVQMAVAGSFVVTAFLFMASVAPTATAYLGFRSNFPLLSDFNYPWYKFIWHPGSSTGKNLECQIDYDHGQEIPFTCEVQNSDMSSVQFSPGTMDWSAHQVLYFDINNPGEPFDLHFRIDDSPQCQNYSCRFNYTELVPGGRSILEVPFTIKSTRSNGHQLHTQSIFRVVLFTMGTASGTRFQIHSLGLR